MLGSTDTALMMGTLAWTSTFVMRITCPASFVRYSERRWSRGTTLRGVEERGEKGGEEGGEEGGERRGGVGEEEGEE